MLNNAIREGYATTKVVCEINESRKTTTKVRVRKKVTRIVISENKRTKSKTKMMMMLKTQVCLRYLVSTTGIMGLSVSCFLGGHQMCSFNQDIVYYQYHIVIL